MANKWNGPDHWPERLDDEGPSPAPTLVRIELPPPPLHEELPPSVDGSLKRGERTSRLSRRTPLEDPARIVVIGGGPAGAFFALEVLKTAAEQGRRVHVSIIEQKVQSSVCCGTMASREGCNYCAGGISPQLVDLLEAKGIQVPEEIVQSRIRSVTIQGHWKHMELTVPEGRRLMTVYRGSRPHTRLSPYSNFDAYLLGCAVERGAEVITGEVRSLRYNPDGLPEVGYRTGPGGTTEQHTLEADFVVVACGVNQRAGVMAENNGLVASLRQVMPDLVLPRVRKALIFEVRGDETELRNLSDEMFFVEYGSRDLHIEMSSFVPKGEGFCTVVLLGKTIDQAHPSEGMSIIRRFLDLPHVRRLLPRDARLDISCACWPNMTVGTARNPFADRVAIVGDLAASRLYKDGILSAHTMATRLACSILEDGVDADSLRRSYWPAVRSVKSDNRYGSTVFMLNRIAFSHPVLSRILYQAVLTERKSRVQADRNLERLLWKIASGDDSYRRILLAFLRPSALEALLFGGALVTLRNFATEVVFGLHWGEIGRFPTGVYREIVERKRREYRENLDLPLLSEALGFESMYSIQIRADRDAILSQLGKFGEPDMPYFRPRIVRVEKVDGTDNEIGKTIRYRTPIPGLGFTIRIESVTDRYVVYRVLDGFAKGGVLIFDIQPVHEKVFLLSIYVAYNFPTGRGFWKRAGWNVFESLFPQYAHDVLWNHALCELKEIAEQG